MDTPDAPTAAPKGIRVTTVGDNIIPDLPLVKRLDTIEQTTPTGLAVSIERRYASTEAGVVSRESARIGTGSEAVRLARSDNDGDGKYEEYGIGVGEARFTIEDPAMKARIDAALNAANIVNVGDLVEFSPKEAGQLASVGYSAISTADLSKEQGR